MAYSIDEDFRAAGNTNRIVADGRGFCVHHAAGTSIDMAPTFMANGTSAHYGVEPGHVRRFLPDECNAWAAGDAWANNHLIHIECVNSGVGGGWPVSEGTVDTLVEFLADKCRELGYARLDVGETLYGHRDFYATFCPGVLYDRLGEIADRVNSLLAGERAPSEWDGPGTRLEGIDEAGTCAAVAAHAAPRSEHVLRAKCSTHLDAVAAMWRMGQLGARLAYGEGLLSLDGYVTAGINEFGTQRFFDMAQRDCFAADLGDTCLVCSTGSYMDAAAAGSASYKHGWPVVWYEDHPNFRDQVARFDRVIVVGGELAVPRLDAETDRWAGDDAPGTMVAVAEAAFDDWSEVAIADGSADSVAACQLGVPVLPAGSSRTDDALRRRRPSNVLWVGGLVAVGYDRRVELCRAAGLL